jgi:RNA polymerase sigma-70 factor (ECF subfamily)
VVQEPGDNLAHTNPDLLRSIKNRGNDRAWSEFDALYRPMLRRFAQARGLSPEDAEDVVQFCMASICTHIEQFTYDPARGRFKSWLRTMVNNRCRDLLRARRPPAVDLGAAGEIPAVETPPEDAFHKIWIDEHINHALRMIRSEVDETTFNAFQAYVLDGRPVEQVCREHTVSPDHLYKVKWRLTRRLRQVMRDLTGDESDWLNQ